MHISSNLPFCSPPTQWLLFWTPESIFFYLSSHHLHHNHNPSKRRRFMLRPWGPSQGSSYPWSLSWQRLDPTELACTLSQDASSLGRRAYYNAELTVSSPANTIASTHCTHSRRDGQAEWAWINTGMVDPPKVVTNPSTNRARRSFILLILPQRRTNQL